MRVTLTVKISVDPDDWRLEYGMDNCPVAEVREDIRRYFETHIGGAPAVEDANLTVVVA